MSKKSVGEMDDIKKLQQKSQNDLRLKHNWAQEEMKHKY